jgi:hypothetical protein
VTRAFLQVNQGEQQSLAQLEAGLLECAATSNQPMNPTGLSIALPRKRSCAGGLLATR